MTKYLCAAGFLATFSLASVALCEPSSTFSREPRDSVSWFLESSKAICVNTILDSSNLAGINVIVSVTKGAEVFVFVIEPGAKEPTVIRIGRGNSTRMNIAKKTILVFSVGKSSGTLTVGN